MTAKQEWLTKSPDVWYPGCFYDICVVFKLLRIIGMSKQLRFTCKSTRFVVLLLSNVFLYLELVTKTIIPKTVLVEWLVGARNLQENVVCVRYHSHLSSCNRSKICDLHMRLHFTLFHESPSFLFWYHRLSILFLLLSHLPIHSQ